MAAWELSFLQHAASLGQSNMVKVKVDDVTKRFGDFTAVDHVTLDVADAEFFTLLGPSGCGKTTTLRLIAGFQAPDKGRIYFDERSVEQLAPFNRNTAMVFQNYALWPHLNVFSNVAYGLKTRKVAKEEITRRVAEALRYVGLEGLEKRFPGELSGGQQQRVALARALVVEPEVLLLDEPLSNLDAKLRVQTRVEMTRLQRRLKITSIYVTHDQEEALCISDRIAVMHKGKVCQIGSPREIYEKPQEPFVADFIGVVNFIESRISTIDKKNGTAKVEAKDGTVLVARLDRELNEGSRVYFSCRPEAVEITPKRAITEAGNFIDADVKLASYLGDTIRYEADTRFGTMRVDVHNPIGKKTFSEGEKATLSLPISSCTLVPLEETR